MASLPDPSRRQFLGAAGAVGTSLLAGRSFGDDVPLAPPDRQPPKLDVPNRPDKTVGWAIVGLGELALGEIMPAFGDCQISKPTALVSGHPDKAEKVAKAYGIKTSSIYNYENYDKLADNPDVQAIYIVLPNSMHAEYTIRGFKAGKHVLCEKPMAVTVADCEKMIAASKEAKKQLMIAYRLRYEPFNMTAIDMCRNGKLGKIQSISASNNQVVQAPNIRLSGELGGGPLGDIGIYCLNATRYLIGLEPVEVAAFSHQPKDDARFREVPATVAWTARFPNDVIVTCDCSFNASPTRRFRVHCDKGFLDLEEAFSYRGQVMTVGEKGKKTRLEITPVNHFAAEMEHFSQCILNNQSPRTPGEEGLADHRVMAAIEESARTGKTVSLKG
jgi:predicted dehydrogenase